MASDLSSMFGGGGPEAIDLELCEQIDEASSSRVSEHLRADSIIFETPLACLFSINEGK